MDSGCSSKRGRTTSATAARASERTGSLAVSADQTSNPDGAATSPPSPGGRQAPAPDPAACPERLRQAAEAGDAEAMYLLGVAHAQGRLVARDEAQAARWFAKAAQRDHLRAKVSLGYCCAAGRGVPRDLEKAYILLREAADAGDRQGFELAEKVAQRLHGEVLRRCEREIRRRRILRAAGQGAASPAEGGRATEPSAPPRADGEDFEIIEIEVPRTGD